MIRSLLPIACFASAMFSGCHRAPSEAQPQASKVVQTGAASFYGDEFAGRKTASGEPLQLGAMTAASRTLPLGARVQVANLDTGQSTEVKINDRGPYADGRVLDLTPKAASHIGITKDQGVGQVSIKLIANPPRPTPQ